MAPVARHCRSSAVVLGLAVHALDRRRPVLETGSPDLLTAGDARPVGSIGDLLEGGVDVVELRLERVDEADHLGALGGGGAGVGEAVAIVHVTGQVARFGCAELLHLVYDGGALLAEVLLGGGDVYRFHGHQLSAVVIGSSDGRAYTCLLYTSPSPRD